jgi:hypothetical protein
MDVFHLSSFLSFILASPNKDFSKLNKSKACVMDYLGWLLEFKEIYK